MSARIWSWLWVIVACGYFFVPVLATAEFSLKAQKGIYSLVAYERIFADPRFATIASTATIASMAATPAEGRPVRGQPSVLRCPPRYVRGKGKG